MIRQSGEHLNFLTELDLEVSGGEFTPVPNLKESGKSDAKGEK